MLERYLDEAFTGPGLHPLLRWHCAPARWSVEAPRQCLSLEPDSGTDFWRRTHYGFQADNGHFLFTQLAGDFVLTTRARFHPAHQYDQAGLMARLGHSDIRVTLQTYAHVLPIIEEEIINAMAEILAPSA